jgi:hypothetical protein
MVKQNIMEEGHGGTKLLTSWPSVSRDRKGQGPNIPFKVTTQINFFQPGPIF